MVLRLVWRLARNRKHPRLFAVCIWCLVAAWCFIALTELVPRDIQLSIFKRCLGRWSQWQAKGGRYSLPGMSIVVPPGWSFSWRKDSRGLVDAEAYDEYWLHVDPRRACCVSLRFPVDYPWEQLLAHVSQPRFGYAGFSMKRITFRGYDARQLTGHKAGDETYIRTFILIPERKLQIGVRGRNELMQEVQTIVSSISFDSHGPAPQEPEDAREPSQ